MTLFKPTYAPLDIIHKNLKKEFPNLACKNDSLYQLRNTLVSYYKEKSLKELDEIKFYLNYDFQHLELYNFDNFFTSRLGYYAIVISVFSIIINPSELLSLYNIHSEKFFSILIISLIILLFSYNITSNYQKNKLIYFRFKEECLNIAINSKNRSSNSKSK